MEIENLKGRSGTYALTSRRPVAFGRVSVLYETTGPAGEVVIAKLFKQEPRTADDKPGALEFFRELDAQSKLQHPHILPIVDFGTGGLDGGPFVIYRFCRGGSLRDVMRQRQYAPLDEVVPLLEQISTALDFAHSRGFIHGDVKPENILFDAGGSHAYLSDFGMARHFAFTARVSTVLADAEGGTTAYLSPEELKDGKQSPRSDLYSFGIVAYQLLTGRLPYEANAPLYRQIQAKVEGTLLDAQEVNPLVSGTVAASLRSILSVSPADRPASAGAFCAMLRGQVDVPAVRTKHDSSAPRVGMWSSLDATGKAGVIGAAIAAMAGIITALIKVLPDLFK